MGRHPINGSSDQWLALQWPNAGKGSDSCLQVRLASICNCVRTFQLYDSRGQECQEHIRTFQLVFICSKQVVNPGEAFTPGRRGTSDNLPPSSISKCELQGTLRGQFCQSPHSEFYCKAIYTILKSLSVHKSVFKIHTRFISFHVHSQLLISLKKI